MAADGADDTARGMIYLDYQATTPLAPEALAAMLPWFETQHANPHSAHRPGRGAKAAVEVARDQIAALLPKGGRVVFTSGATEALNWAIKGTPPGDVVTLATEHAAVIDTMRAVAAPGRRNIAVLPVRSDGLVDRGAAADACLPGVSLVAAMLVNNEIGTIRSVAEMSTLADFAGAPLLCDAVQGFGRIDIPTNVDLVAVSAHKIHGPKGIGALWIRDGVALDPLLHGGDQEGGRSGTLSPALCAGFGVAARLMAERREADAAHVGRLWEIAVGRLRGWQINGSVEQRYRGNLNVRRDGLDVARLMSECRDIAFSAGSACASGSGRSSHVLRAIGLNEAQARSSIRLGFGRYTTEDELRAGLDAIVAAADRQRP